MLVPRAPDTFLGRDRELQRLLALPSRQRLMLLKGLAGVGKTALALRFVEEVRAREPDLVIRWVRCQPGGTFDDVAAELDEGGEAPAGTRERILRAVRALNRRPGLLLLEDVHWLPEPELAQLVEALRVYLEGRALLTSRTELPLPALETIDVYQEKLDGLPGPEAVRLLRSLLDLHGRGEEWSADMLAGLAAEVGGHPFLLRLLASLAVTRALSPTGVTVARQRLLDSVLEDLGSEERDFLDLAALARGALPAPCVARLAQLPQDVLARLERRFLVEPSGALHDLLAQHVAAEMAPARRQVLHRRLAEHWEAAGEARLAFPHALEAGALEQASTLLAQAAAAMVSRGQYQALLDDVQGLHAAGGAVPPSARLMQAHVYSVTGRGDEALELLSALTGESMTPEVRAEALTALGGTHLNRGSYGPACECYERALALTEPGQAAWFKCLNYLGLIHGYRGELRRADELLQRSLALARQAGHRSAQAYALRIRATLHALAREFTPARALAQEALQLALELGATRVASFARYALVLAARHLEEARALLAEIDRDAREQGDFHLQAYVHLELGQLAWEQGDLEEAGRELQLSAEWFARQGDGQGVGMAELRLAGVRAEEGRRAEARSLAERTLQAARARDNPRLEAEARLALAEQALEAGELAVARTHAAEARELLAGLDVTWLRSEAGWVEAESHVREFAAEEARRVLAELEEGARTWALLAVLPGADGKRLRRAAETARAALAGVAARREQRFEARLSASLSKPFTVLRGGESARQGEQEVQRLRECSGTFAFFLDEPASRLVVRGAELPLFRRRVLSRLLLVLVRAGERGLATEELGPAVWGQPYAGESTALEVRKAVARLRELLEEERAAPRIIVRLEAVRGIAGRYLFRAPEESCVILGENHLSATR